MSSVRVLEERLEAAISAYRAEFGGQRRDTRDLSRLDLITSEARAVLSMLERHIGPLPPRQRRIFEEAKKWIGLFVKERDAIVAEKALPERTPERAHISEPGTRANLLTSMLRARFHTGAERVDLALVYEVIEALTTCERDMVARTPKQAEPWMLHNLLSVRSSLAACRTQESEFAKALDSGPPSERRAFALQLGADLTFFLDWEAKYVTAGAQRSTRLRHAAATLRLLAERARKGGALTGAEGEPLAAMLERAELLDAKHDALRGERHHLEDGAALVLERELVSIAKVYRANFAGKSRATVPLALLRRTLYRGASIAMQASELAIAHPTDRAIAFRRRAVERAILYEKEETAVSEEQTRARRR